MTAVKFAESIGAAKAAVLAKHPRAKVVPLKSEQGGTVYGYRVDVPACGAVPAGPLAFGHSVSEAWLAAGAEVTGVRRFECDACGHGWASRDAVRACVRCGDDGCRQVY